MVSLLAFISCQMLPTNKMADFGRAWYREREGIRLSPEVTTGQRRPWVGLLCENPHPTSLLVSKQFYWVEWDVFDVESLLEGSNAVPAVHQAALKYS